MKKVYILYFLFILIFSSCAQYKENIELQSMTFIPAGEFDMGGENADFMNDWPLSAQSRSDERPVHKVKISNFWISTTLVTNKEFKEFIDATGYITTAEVSPKLEDIMKSLPPGSREPSKEFLVPGSMVFNAPKNKVSLNNPLSWWSWVPGANWKNPEGPNSNIINRMDHPVVHVSYYDAKAYANWKGMSLPTESQWEYAARGGENQKTFIWGNTPLENMNTVINIWEGIFPNLNTKIDGYVTTSPVEAFPPNKYGLYDMSGNVWEWVLDWYDVKAYEIRSKNDISIDPQGPQESFDPYEPYIQKRVIRGGSFLCNDDYCSGYRPAARMKNSPDTSSNHIGFRIVKN